MDENPLLRRAVKSRFKSSGYVHLSIAESFRKALHLLKNRPIDLIIADSGEFPSTGLKLLLRVRENPALENIPFLMLLRQHEPKIIEAALNAGASGFLIKPVSFAVLEREMARILDDD
ncbi:MAG: response regulator [Nitrospinae bacterium]|nr:response regulator [Nitrospinota bacterium]